MAARARRAAEQGAGPSVGGEEHRPEGGGGAGGGGALASGLDFPRNAVLAAALVGLWVLALSALYALVVARAVALGLSGNALAVPSSLEDLRAMQEALRAFVRAEWGLSVVAYAAMYLTKQTFSLPGSAALNVLGGLAFGLSMGWPMAVLLAASGSSLCYALSWLLMGGALRSVSGDSTWRAARTLHSVRSKTEQVKLEGRLTLLTYLISLRLFPGTPNWLLNMAMPHCGVPLSLFFLSVLLGLAPYTFVTVSAGSVLATVESITDVLDGWLLLKLSAAALILAGVAPALRAAEARNKVARLSAAD
jgi:uncharacterized membrane protein YdjX (TVP38/TMEM64 family)